MPLIKEATIQDKIHAKECINEIQNESKQKALFLEVEQVKTVRSVHRITNECFDERYAYKIKNSNGMGAEN